MATPHVCPLCKNTGAEISPDGDNQKIACPLCGSYAVSGSLFGTLNGEPEDQRRSLSYAARKADDAGQRLELNTGNWQAIAAQEAAISMVQKQRLLLQHVWKRSENQGGRMVAVNALQDRTLFSAANDAEAYWLLDALVDVGYLQRSTLGIVRLTPAGWEAISPVSGIVPRSCFVAMAFHEALDAAYTDGIEPAVKHDCGFETVQLNKVEHNENINDKIISEIRKSQFLVADVTLQRNGVYFEAGFALGLGRPVVWCCREDDFDHVHFDARPYAFIIWKDERALREKLRDRIRATIPNATLE